MPNPLGIDDVKFIELRLKCIKPFIKMASKYDISKSETITYAEKAWNDFVVKPLVDEQAKILQNRIEPEPMIHEAPITKSKIKKY